MSPAQDIDLSNEKLVAYIDGELSSSEQELVAEALMHDEEARDRLAVLKNGSRPFAEAFDVLLNVAPDDKLQAMFAEVLAKKRGGGSLDEPEIETAKPADENVVPLRRKPSTSGTPIWRMAAAAAILAFVFAGGLYTGGFIQQPQQAGEEQVGWREAAARYVALFSRETLVGMPDDPQQRQANIQRIQTALGLQLSDERLASSELSFSGTQLLQLEDKPLAQISYLYEGETPVALCIIRTADASAGPATENRHGLNVVHWVADGYGFMVIGNVPDGELSRIADDFRRRFS